jgi:Matrixin
MASAARRASVVAIATVAVAVVAAAVGGNLNLTAAQEVAYQDRAWPKREAIWESNRIPVCWESFNDSATTFRDQVRTAVRDSWEAASGVKFTGWGECSSQEGGIRIAVKDEPPHTDGLGREIAGKPEGMVLNATFANVGSQDAPYQNWVDRCRTQKDYCIRVTVVHEFGHALGLAHEQYRPHAGSSNACIQETMPGENGDWALGDYDPNSVMNYCNPKWNGDGRLSDLDKHFAVYVYGEHV